MIEVEGTRDFKDYSFQPQSCHGKKEVLCASPAPYTTPQGWGALSSTSLSLVEGEVPRTPSPFEFPTPQFVKLLKVKENMNLFSFWHSVSVSVSDQANACLIFTHLLKLRPTVPADPTDPRWHWDWRDEHFGIGPFRSGIRSGPKETRLWRRGAHPFLQCPQRGNNGAGVMDHVVSVAPLPTLPLISPAIQKRTRLCSSRLTLWGHLAQCSACGWGIMGHSWYSRWWKWRWFLLLSRTSENHWLPQHPQWPLRVLSLVVCLWVPAIISYFMGCPYHLVGQWVPCLLCAE